MEKILIIFAWTSLIVSSTVFIFCAVAIAFKLKERRALLETTSSAEPESPDSTLSELASDSIFPQNEPTVFFQNKPVELAQTLETQFIQEQNEIAESIQKQFAEYSQSKSTEISMDEPVPVQFSQDALNELPVDHQADSSQDDQEDEPESIEHVSES